MNQPHQSIALAGVGRLESPPTLVEPMLVQHVVEKLREMGIDAQAVCVAAHEAAHEVAHEVVKDGVPKRVEISPDAQLLLDGSHVIALPGCGVWGVATPKSVDLTAALSRVWAADAAELMEARQALEGFTLQMSDAYDTIDMLYSIGRSMRAPDAPTPFIKNVVERLHSVMHFGWVTARFLDGARVPRSLRNTLHTHGNLTCALAGEQSNSARCNEEVVRALDEAAAQLGDGAKRWQILASNSVLSSKQAPQVLLQPISYEGRLVGVIAAGNKGGSDILISSYDLQLVEAAAGHVSAFVENVALYQAQQDLFLGTIQAITAAIDAKDRYTCGHSERVAFLASEIARLTGVDADSCRRVHIAGLVHDVGKIGVPEAVLTKRGRLTDEEFGLIKLHPTIGHRILCGIPLLEDVIPSVLHHHERIDGRGYPHQISGDAIPLFARLIAVADTFDAMSSDRSYRPAMPRERVLAELQRSAGSQLDAALVQAFMQINLSKYDELVQRHAQDQDEQLASDVPSLKTDSALPATGLIGTAEVTNMNEEAKKDKAA